jgi:hydroxyacylglutathione hydrolase
MPIEVNTVPVGFDNYAYLVIDGTDALIIDAVSADPLKTILKERNLTLRFILSTHHHGDHTGGNRNLKNTTGCAVIGGDKRITALDRLSSDNEIINEGPFTFTALSVPGHTRGCTAWYFHNDGLLFTGDTLFYAGCGRLFEGNATRMHHSLSRIRSLPPSTILYCGHEYTLDNLRFARSVDPGNPDIDKRFFMVEKKLKKGFPSGPARLSEECATNPFLRTGEMSLRKAVQLIDAPESAVFTALRKRKDSF